jgi:hypothetical protein
VFAWRTYVDANPIKAALLLSSEPELEDHTKIGECIIM